MVYDSFAMISNEGFFKLNVKVRQVIIYREVNQ